MNMSSGQDLARGQQQYGAMLRGMRSVFKSGRTKDVEWRKRQLRQMLRGFSEMHEEITAAVRSDLAGSKFRGVADMALTLAEIHNALENVDSWAMDERPNLSPVSSARIRKEPKGIVLIIAPWNYPVAMCFDPLVAVIAAGNCAVIKPSEISQNAAPIVQKFVEKYLDPECFKVVQGAVPETTALLAQKWDHIMYTGNGAVGRIVMAAAAKNLTPVTLELGGKSPTYVDKSAKLEHAVQRINWWKWLNVGQTCITPDYVMVHEDICEEFVRLSRKVIQEWYGKTPEDQKKNSKLGRIISARHAARIKSMLESTKGKIVQGGAATADVKSRWLPPTIVVDPHPDDKIMKEEIFGPILPIMTVRGVGEAIDIVHRTCPDPLALYVYAEDEEVIDQFIENTSSGGVTVNSAFVHMMNTEAPFGGVGESGMGSYHGKYGFDEFTHRRTVVRESTLPVVGKPLTLVMPHPGAQEKIYDLAMRKQLGTLISEKQKRIAKVVGACAVVLLGLRSLRSRM